MVETWFYNNDFLTIINSSMSMTELPTTQILSFTGLKPALVEPSGIACHGRTFQAPAVSSLRSSF